MQDEPEGPSMLDMNSRMDGREMLSLKSLGI
jgi:hypothetical protein